MNKYSEIEKLGELLSKGLITESEYQAEKVKFLNDNSDISKERAPSRLTDDEIARIKNINERYSKAQQLGATGKYAGAYLAVAFIAVVFGLIKEPGNARSDKGFYEIFVMVVVVTSFPAIFVLPIYLMRSKKRNAAHAESKSIIAELSLIQNEVDRLRDLSGKNKSDGNQSLSESQRRLILVLSSVMLIGFFVPWISQGGRSMNGMGIFKAGEDYKSCYLIGLLPLLSLLSVIKSAKPEMLSFPAANSIPLLAGLSPYFILGLLYLANSNEINAVISVYSNIVSIGLPMIILASAGLVIFGRKKSHYI